MATIVPTPVRILSEEEEVSGLTQKLQWRANNLATVVQVANHVYNYVSQLHVSHSGARSGYEKLDSSLVASSFFEIDGGCRGTESRLQDCPDLYYINSCLSTRNFATLQCQTGMKLQRMHVHHSEFSYNYTVLLFSTKTACMQVACGDVVYLY